ncbi:HEAT repeat domain-containing protein [Angustibacter peucedani]
MDPAPDDGAGLTPKERALLAAETLGERELVGWCAALLRGDVAPDDPDAPHLTWLGGVSAARYAADPEVDPTGRAYWPQVWAARTLLYVWAPSTVLTGSVVGALAHEAWRVREMAAKVAAARELGEAGEALEPLVDDEVPRVRAAAVRALGVVGEGEALDAVRDALDDPYPAVHRAAELSLRRLQQRLDRW